MHQSKVKKLLIAMMLSALTALIACLFSTPVEAGRLRAGIFLTQSEIPKKLTEKGLISFVKGRKTIRLVETPGGDVKKRVWKANMLVTFNGPPGDLEYEVLFYDIHDGPRRLVQEMSTFISDKTQKTYIQKIVLARPRFKPNRNMEVAVIVHREEVGIAKFGVLGEEPRRSGTVNFSDDETK
jgi:hypothetical protein